MALSLQKWFVCVLTVDPESLSQINKCALELEQLKFDQHSSTKQWPPTNRTRCEFRVPFFRQRNEFSHKIFELFLYDYDGCLMRCWRSGVAKRRKWKSACWHLWTSLGVCESKSARIQEDELDVCDCVVVPTTVDYILHGKQLSVDDSGISQWCAWNSLPLDLSNVTG